MVSVHNATVGVFVCLRDCLAVRPMNDLIWLEGRWVEGNFKKVDRHVGRRSSCCR